MIGAEMVKKEAGNRTSIKTKRKQKMQPSQVIHWRSTETVSREAAQFDVSCLEQQEKLTQGCCHGGHVENSGKGA